MNNESTQNENQSEDQLVSSRFFDQPISLLPFLMYKIEKKLKAQLQFLSEQKRQARKIYVHLRCEYESLYHLLEIDLECGKLNVDNIMDSVERKLLEIDFSNPVREIEIETVPAERKNPIRKLRSRLTTGYMENKEDGFLDLSWFLTANSI